MSARARLFSSEQQQLAERVCAVAEDAYYEILQVQEEAHEEEIKRAFKRLALQLHPDKNAAPRAEDAFKLVAEAWAVLGNAQKRATYNDDRRHGFRTNLFDDDEDWLDDDTPPLAPPLNETRTQRRQREYDEREAARRAKEQAERLARQKERDRRRAAKSKKSIDELLKTLRVEFHYCKNCSTLHIHMPDEQGPCIHPVPTPPPHQSWSRPGATTRVLSLDFVVQMAPIAVAPLIAVGLSEALPIIWTSWWSTIATVVTLFVGARLVPLPYYVQEELQGLRRQIQQFWRRVVGGERVALQLLSS